MAIEKHQEQSAVIRDARTGEQRLFDFLGGTDVTSAIFAVAAIASLVFPWAIHFVIPICGIWFLGVFTQEDRRTLPMFLPSETGITDHHDRVGRRKFKSRGVLFLGNADRRLLEVWETSDFARRHKLILGTTGAGKTQLLYGFVLNSLCVGAGLVYSDAKGTTELVSQIYRMVRKLGRDDDFLTVNYNTGARTIRKGDRERITNTTNPVAFLTADQIFQMFSSYLPESSGDNQIFQERAVTQLAACAPALVDLRDLHEQTLTVENFRLIMTNMNAFVDLAHDPNNLLPKESQERLRKCLASINFPAAALSSANPVGADGRPLRAVNGIWTIDKDVAKQFGYGAQYFNRAFSSLADTYGHIYMCATGEVDYIDVALNRRILVITLPALEKSPTELQQLAKTNLTNLRGAFAVGLGSKIEGSRKNTLDNLPTKAKTPTSIILDEYGYQATEGFAIAMAQARSLNFSINIAAQDLSNLKMGSEKESEAIYGNAVLIAGQIRNVQGLGERIKEFTGEADVAVMGSMEKKGGIFSSSYMDERNVSIQRRNKVSSSDLGESTTATAYIFPGGGMGAFKYYPFGPAPSISSEMQINRFVEVIVLDSVTDVEVGHLDHLNRMLDNRMSGLRLPHQTPGISPALQAALQAKDMESLGRLTSEALAGDKPTVQPSAIETQLPPEAAKFVGGFWGLPGHKNPSPSAFGVDRNSVYQDPYEDADDDDPDDSDTADDFSAMVEDSKDTLVNMEAFVRGRESIPRSLVDQHDRDIRQAGQYQLPPDAPATKAKVAKASLALRRILDESKKSGA